MVFSGHNKAELYNVQRKSAQTLALLNEPLAFARMLDWACGCHLGSQDCTLHVPYVRLNVFSDIPWELVYPDLFHRHPGQFYDYTKIAGRLHADEILNYDLTFSFSGTNQQHVRSELEHGRRVAVAVVFLAHKEKQRGRGRLSHSVWKTWKKKAPLPKRFWGHAVVSGDISDLRPLDPAPSIVGLSWKTPAGQQLDPTREGFAFVVPTYQISEDSLGVTTDDSRGWPRENPDEGDWLITPVTPRSQGIR